jgi:hypothetical protein
VVCLAPRAPGDSVRPRRLAGVGTRPLNFTVRGHMLGWRDLTRGQRAGAVFLLVIFLVAAPALVFFVPTTAGDHVWYAGMMACYLGVLLDPQWFRLRYSATANFAAMPPVCRILLSVGVVLAAAGFVMGHLRSGGA